MHFSSVGGGNAPLSSSTNYNLKQKKKKFQFNI